MDGERLDLLSSQFDALGAQFDTFIQWVKGTGGPGPLAGLDDAARVMRVLEESGTLFQQAA